MSVGPVKAIVEAEGWLPDFGSASNASSKVAPVGPALARVELEGWLLGFTGKAGSKEGSVGFVKVHG